MGHCGNAWDTIILLKLLLWVWATQSWQATCIFGRGADDNKDKGHKNFFRSATDLNWVDSCNLFYKLQETPNPISASRSSILALHDDDFTNILEIFSENTETCRHWTQKKEEKWIMNCEQKKNTCMNTQLFEHCLIN